MAQKKKAAIYMRIGRKKRAWIYCRVAAPDKAALRMQKKALSAYAEEKQFEVVGITTEQGSGLSFDRDGIAKISRAVKQNQIDVLLIANISRLGRNTFEVLKYIHWLDSCGVRVVCMDGTM
ncbi:recombinase family protein [Enterocloster clostridioformis]|uniref:recombinase family protein n=1 Tax=Enterocloster clostridioformis TaxID=1531 RepID=UPI0008ED5A49|nr:recombinase family protein [Enterocloster clostridioformis]SFG86356.1 Resolvase, N terminal domain [Enterocloster clostridioformis]